MILYCFLLSIVTTCVHSHFQKNEGLKSSLDYGLKNKVNDLNFLLGVAIAKGQLGVIMETKELNTSEMAKLQILQEKCDNLLKLVPNIEDPLALALTPNLWSLDYPFHSLRQSSKHHHLVLIEAGPLSRELSDYCLRSMLSRCSLLPRQCQLAELSDQAVGYTLTHQLLFWTLAVQICYKDDLSRMMVKSLIKHKCRKVYGERLDILALGLPLNLRDLYFEQVVICGLHGFLPFLTLSDQDLLLSLQTPDGCFAPQQKGHMQECDNHLSGIAIAALSLLHKYQIE